jgi:AmmeMemoRadiSam system protein A
VLLDIARRSLTLAVTHGTFLDGLPADDVLSQPGGAFVTLHRCGRLRGCIGQFATDLPLVEVIAHCAAAVARDDPRFDAVQPEELVEIEIEISVLSEAVEIDPATIDIGRHGLVVSCGEKRGVLLPQVSAQYKWTSERFLQETCVKAGLDRNAWKLPSTRIEAFTAETFSESKPQRANGGSSSERQPDEYSATDRGYSTST